MSLFGNDNRNRVPVTINGETKLVPDDTTADEILAIAGHDARNRSLMVEDQNGMNQVIPKNRRITPVSGEAYEATLPWEGGLIS